VCVEMRARSNRVDNAANGLAIRENMEDVKGKGEAVKKTALP
jgi:hypothetical protein